MATVKPARSPQAITAYPDMAGIADNIPVVMPTPIQMMPRGIITSNAPTKGMRRIVSGMTNTIPINPPRTMAMGIFDGEDRIKYTTRATNPPENVPMKKSAIFKFIFNFAFNRNMTILHEYPPWRQRARTGEKVDSQEFGRAAWGHSKFYWNLGLTS